MILITDENKRYKIRHYAIVINSLLITVIYIKLYLIPSHILLDID